MNKKQKEGYALLHNNTFAKISGLGKASFSSFSVVQQVSITMFKRYMAVCLKPGIRPKQPT